ncbi:MAG TPA: phosphoglycerate dehydrogenase, partial [Firmicutes bacterium]|nr:phosphoglycerate dehydrogenase [Bacillota bacterium]
MAKVLLLDNVAREGAAVLERAGHSVEMRNGHHTPEELVCCLQGCAGLIVRSATRVTAEVLAAAPNLAVVGRAGVGVDNIDVAAASRYGVLVVNAPEGNTLAAAEHTIALMLALARHIPQAVATLRAGRWERQGFLGVELAGKTLGILGLGRVGRKVAVRARALEMRVLAYDPYVSAEEAARYGAEVAELERVLQSADFLTIHLPLTRETRGLISAAALAQMKPGVRIINAARGEIIDEAALAAAVRDGRVAGAALDVLAHEPCTESP